MIVLNHINSYISIVIVYVIGTQCPTAEARRNAPDFQASIPIVLYLEWPTLKEKNLGKYLLNIVTYGFILTKEFHGSSGNGQGTLRVEELTVWGCRKSQPWLGARIV